MEFTPNGIFKSVEKGEVSLEADLSKNICFKANEADFILDWLQESPCLLSIQGIIGSGKTYICNAVSNILTNQKALYLYMTESSFCRTLEHCARKNMPYAALEWEIEKVLQTPVLIIDDVGMFNRTEFQRKTLIRILAERCKKDYWTLFSSCESLSSIFFRYGFGEVYENLNPGKRKQIELIEQNIRQIKR